MDLYGPAKLFKASNRDTWQSLETMEWCSEDNNITNFSKILLKFAVVFKIFEYFCPFLSLAIITGQRSPADGLHERDRETKNFSEQFFTTKCGNFSFEFCTFSFF